jgi:hypothetical protein
MLAASLSAFDPTPTSALPTFFLQLVKIRSDDVTRLLAAHDWHYLKCSARPPPSKYPLLKQAEVIAFHELKTSTKIRLDPAINVLEPIRQHPAAFPEFLVCGQHVLILETLDDHEKHCQLRCVFQENYRRCMQMSFAVRKRERQFLAHRVE